MWQCYAQRLWFLGARGWSTMFIKVWWWSCSGYHRDTSSSIFGFSSSADQLRVTFLKWLAVFIVFWKISMSCFKCRVFWSVWINIFCALLYVDLNVLVHLKSVGYVQCKIYTYALFNWWRKNAKFVNLCWFSWFEQYSVSAPTNEYFERVLKCRPGTRALRRSIHSSRTRSSSVHLLILPSHRSVFDGARGTR